jgi:hypothetical protein
MINKIEPAGDIVREIVEEYSVIKKNLMIEP